MIKRFRGTQFSLIEKGGVEAYSPPVYVVLCIIFCYDQESFTFIWVHCLDFISLSLFCFICLCDFLASCMTHREMAVVLIKSPTKSTNNKYVGVFFSLCMIANLWLVPVRRLRNDFSRLFKTGPLELLRCDPLQPVKSGRCEILCSDHLRLGLLDYIVTTLYDLRLNFLNYFVSTLHASLMLNLLNFYVTKHLGRLRRNILKYCDILNFEFTGWVNTKFTRQWRQYSVTTIFDPLRQKLLNHSITTLVDTLRLTLLNYSVTTPYDP